MATEWISRDSIVAALDMCAVLEHYDIKAGRGTSFRIHCPFHEDDRPSCSVNPDAKVFNCFSCGEQGNVLDFIAGMEDLDPKAEFRAVLEKAIDIIGHNPTPQKNARTGTRNSRNRAGRTKGSRTARTGDAANSKQVSNHASSGSEADIDQAVHDGNSAAETNVPKKGKKRSATKGINQSDGSLQLEANRVLEGPAFPLKLQDKHPWLDVQLTRIGVNRSMAAEFGIGFESRSNALMANRVCFPIHNGEGDLVAYAGRWASDDADDQGRFFTENGREQPRYRLPKGFHKQLELFNWHRVLEQFENANSQTVGTVVLVEGFWSVLRLQAMTIPSVALMGLSISDAQIRLLLEGGIRSVIVMLDGDNEGQAAMESIVPMLASHFFTRSVILPEGTKPDDVDLKILNEVRALCVGTEFGTIPTSAVRAKRRPSSKQKPVVESRDKVSAETAKPVSRQSGGSTKRSLEPSDNASTKHKPNSPSDYALPQSTGSASFGWTGFS